jgi:hypothetical protein
LVQKQVRKCASNGTKWCTKNYRWCLHLVTENDHLEPPKSQSRARWNISPEITRRLCYLRAFVRWLLPPWSTFVLFERERGGGPGHVSMAKWARFCIPNRQEMPGSSEQGQELRGLCIPRSLPRWHDPDPLGGLSPAYIPENRKGRRGGATGPCTECCVLSDEAEEFRGYHRLGRSLQDSVHQLV